MFEKIMSILQPKAQDWRCRYWNLYDAERFSENFSSHNEAHEFALSKQKLGYLTTIYQDDPEEPVDLLSSVLTVLSSGSVSGAWKNVLGLLKNILKHHVPKG